MNTKEIVQTREVERPERPVEVGSQDIVLSSREVRAGAIAGLGAGFTMGVVVILVSLSNGFGFWAPFNDVAGALFPSVLAGTRSQINPQTIIVAILIHFTISVLLGMLFTSLYSGLIKLTFEYGVPITIGLTYSWLVWMIVRFLFLPWLRSGVYEAPAFIIAHGVYGVTLGFLYPRVRQWAIARGQERAGARA